MSSAVVITLEFAPYARWCWIIATISSAISTLDCSMAPALIMPRPPLPAAPNTAPPLSDVATQRPLPARPSDVVDANLATTNCPTGTLLPLEYCPSTNPSALTETPVNVPDAYPSWATDDTLLCIANCVRPSTPVPPALMGVPIVTSIT